MIKIEIETDNAAFEGDDRIPEIVRILRALAGDLEGERIPTGEGFRVPLRDVNGNRVGWVNFS